MCYLPLNILFDFKTSLTLGSKIIVERGRLSIFGNSSPPNLILDPRISLFREIPTPLLFWTQEYVSFPTLPAGKVQDET